MDLSVIIPVSKRENDFKLIKQLREKFKDCEIIIVADEANKLVELENLEVDQLYLLNNLSRAKALNKGANFSTRKNLWFLHLDSNLDHIQLSDVIALNEFTMSTFLLQFDQANCWWIAAGANFRTKIFGIPFGDQSFLVSKKLFNFIGDFNESLLEGEDHEFIWRTKSLNIRLNVINKKIITSAIKYKNKKIYQTVQTLIKTIFQAAAFCQSRKSIVLGIFLKDPQSSASKSRLRTILNDKFVNELNLNFLKIININLENLKQKKNIHFIKVCKYADEEKLNSLSKICQGKFINQDEELSLIMSQLSQLSLETVGKVALLGSDIPTLKAEDLDEVLLKKLDKSSHFLSTKDGGFCFMISNDQNIIECLRKIKCSTTFVMQDLTECLQKVNIAKKIFTDVDEITDLREVYSELKSAETNLSVEQKNLLRFLKAYEKSFI